MSVRLSVVRYVWDSVAPPPTRRDPSFVVIQDLVIDVWKYFVGEKLKRRHRVFYCVYSVSVYLHHTNFWLFETIFLSSNCDVTFAWWKYWNILLNCLRYIMFWVLVIKCEGMLAKYSKAGSKFRFYLRIVAVRWPSVASFSKDWKTYIHR